LPFRNHELMIFEPQGRTRMNSNLSSTEDDPITHSSDKGPDRICGDEANSNSRSVPNPTGRNQFNKCPRKTPQLQELLRRYHRITTNRRAVSGSLARYYGINISERTIARRWKEMGLKGSGATEASLSPEEIVQIIHRHAGDRPSERLPSKVKRRIAREAGVHLKRETVARVLRDNPLPRRVESEHTSGAVEEMELTAPVLALVIRLVDEIVLLRDVLVMNMTDDIRHDLTMLGSDWHIEQAARYPSWQDNKPNEPASGGL